MENKTLETVKAIIDVKINEHTKIVEQISADFVIMQQKFSEMVAANPAKETLMTQTNLIMTLKDRIMFHKAALLTLKDVRSELDV